MTIIQTLQELEDKRLLDKFAGMAMQAMCLDALVNGNNLIAHKLARTSYKLAEAMLAEKQKRSR